MDRYASTLKETWLAIAQKAQPLLYANKRQTRNEAALGLLKLRQSFDRQAMPTSWTRITPATASLELPSRPAPVVLPIRDPLLRAVHERRVDEPEVVAWANKQRGFAELPEFPRGFYG